MNKKERRCFYLSLCFLTCSAPCFQEPALHTESALIDLSQDSFFVRDGGYSQGPSYAAEKDFNVVRHDHIFDVHFPSYLRPYRLPLAVTAQIMRILKNDGVDCSGRYTVCVLLNVKDNRIISFRWQRADGVQRAYYAYSKKASGEKFYNHKGVCTVGRCPFVMPLENVRISSPFGMRKHPIHRTYKPHKGVDFSAPKGTPVYASGSGKVIHVGSLSGYGKCVRIRHSGGYVTMYAHLNRYAKNLRKGSFVVVGDSIGQVGMTGSATAPHLHYEVRRGKSLLNPVLYTEKVMRLSGKEKKSFENQMNVAKKHYAL